MGKRTGQRRLPGSGGWAWRAADHRGGPRGDHTGGRSPARRAWIAGDEGPAVRILRPRQCVSAPRIRGRELGNLHRYPRQRHDRRLVELRRPRRPQLRPPLPRQGVRLRPGFRTTGLRVGGGEGRRPDAGLSGARPGAPDEHSRHHRRQLVLASGRVSPDTGAC